jgi:hypothetical protein
LSKNSRHSYDRKIKERIKLTLAEKTAEKISKNLIAKTTRGFRVVWGCLVAEKVVGYSTPSPLP